MESDNKNDGTRGDYHSQWTHHQVGTLIRSTEHFIVHIDTNGDLDWETTAQYDQIINGKPEYNLATHNSILTDVALLEASPCDGIEEHIQRHFKRLLGEALTCSLESDYVTAKKMVVAARKYLEARSEETSRDWYLSASIKTCLPFAGCGAIIWIFRGYFSSLLGEDVTWLALAAVAGAIGALFSVIARTGRLKVDASAGLRLHNLEGMSRIIAGAVSGLLVALAVRTEIILAVFTRDHKLHPVMMLAALVAGAGERLAASIISKFDATHVNVTDANGSVKADERKTK